MTFKAPMSTRVRNVIINEMSRLNSKHELRKKLRKKQCANLNIARIPRRHCDCCKSSSAGSVGVFIRIRLSEQNSNLSAMHGLTMEAFSAAAIAREACSACSTWANRARLENVRGQLEQRVEAVAVNVRHTLDHRRRVHPLQSTRDKPLSSERDQSASVSVPAARWFSLQTGLLGRVRV